MKTPTTLPSQEFLAECFHYEPETGKLIWRVRPPEHFGSQKRSPVWSAKNWNARYSGTPALSSPTSKGYLSGFLCGSHVLAHRVIWKLVNGSEPEMIDHINRNKGDNRIANLRPADKRLNSRNVGLYKTNTSGVAGVSAKAGGFQATIRDETGARKTKWLRSLAEAAAWRREAEKQFNYPEQAA